jgi:DNA-binding transcriptional ArsR family regulator
MFKLLEKWVNEHGSANIMEKRLDLKDDEMAAIHRELTSLMAEHSQLESENKDLKVSLEKSEKKVHRLEEIINADTKSNSKNEISNSANKVITKLFELNKEITISELSSLIDLKENITQYHIDILVEADYVDTCIPSIGRPLPYKISSLGRKYVVEEIGI